MNPNTFIIGNPPFAGFHLQSAEQKEDTQLVWRGVAGSGVLDYVANWFILAGRWAYSNGCRVGFVATNSISQGQQVALLWQHLFWFLGHPEVYVLILPAMGIVTEIIACNKRKPIWGYRSMVYAVLTIGFLSFIVWAHHMYLTGMGTHIATFFQTTTMMISIPSVIILTALFI